MTQNSSGLEPDTARWKTRHLKHLQSNCSQGLDKAVFGCSQRLDEAVFGCFPKLCLLLFQGEGGVETPKAPPPPYQTRQQKLAAHTTLFHHGAELLYARHVVLRGGQKRAKLIGYSLALAGFISPMLKRHGSFTKQLLCFCLLPEDLPWVVLHVSDSRSPDKAAH